MPLTIIKSDGKVLITPPMYQKESTDVAEVEKSNPVEQPAEPANVGEKVAITNPIEPMVVYSDAPGAGPNDAPPASGENSALADALVEAGANAEADEADADGAATADEADTGDETAPKQAEPKGKK